MTRIPLIQRQNRRSGSGTDREAVILYVNKALRGDSVAERKETLVVFALFFQLSKDYIMIQTLA